QDTTTAIDSLGNIVTINLLKGKFKQHENNPKREDGTIYLYCPPLQVDSEMENLINILDDLEKKQVKPIIIASWFHHAFTQIHPFQDGNGRIARLLASLILIKHKLFPFTVRGKEKKKYIDSLELADNRKPQSLIDFFCEVEKRNIEEALNQNFQFAYSKTSFTDVADVFSKKLESWKQKTLKSKTELFEINRNKIFEICNFFLNELKQNLIEKLKGNAEIFIETCSPNNVEKRTNYTIQISEYAKTHNYFFNRTMPRGWFRFVIKLSKERQYQLIISIHHFGYDDSTIAIGAFLDFIEPMILEVENKRISVKRKKNIIAKLPFEIAPLTVSLDVKINDLENEIKSFLQDTVTLTLAQIASEIN
ncbi:MAG: hypothetical protein A2033_12625, partial [Bacteroidetes bacterium GWA2_31_9]